MIDTQNFTLVPEAVLQPEEPKKPSFYPKQYPTSEARRELCRVYCEYLKQGYSKQFFPECATETMRRYIKEFPEDFDEDEMDKALRIGLNFIERCGMAGMLGKIEKFNPTTWIFIMKNRAGWKDRIDTTSDDKVLTGPVVYIPKENE